MKKGILCLLASALLFSLTGCAREAPSSSQPPASSPQPPTSSAPTPEPAPQPAPTSTAARCLAARVAENDSLLYVYKDFADGLNHFTQKAWMGSDLSDIPPMNEHAEGTVGVSGIMAELDLGRHSWGGYMFLNGTLAAGGSEPACDFGDADAGLDLTGATRLTFYARGETGQETVEFFAGGLGWQNGLPGAPYPDSTDTISAGNIALTAEWQQYEIDLTGADLSRLACGFGWVTNDVSNDGLDTVRFYLDDIRYEFGTPQPGPLFLASYAPAAPDSDEGLINSFAYLYDNAATAIALAAAGEQARAEQIADAIVYALENDRYLDAARALGGFILTLRDDSPGFLAGYEGWEGEATAATYKSTEHNIDLIPAFAHLAALTEGGESEGYLDASEEARAFVLTMYDEEAGCFYTGTGADGVTVNRDVLPLDCNTWALLALGDDFPDTDRVLAFIDKTMAVDGGYDFNEDCDGVWFEGTAQAALCFRLAGDEARHAELLALMEEHQLPDGSLPAADRDGVTTGFVVSGTDIPWTYSHRGHVGATAWLAFAQLGHNPFAQPA